MALILIVDDSPTEVHVMQKALEKHGFTTARGGRRRRRPAAGPRDAPGPDLHGHRDAGHERLPGHAQLANDPQTRAIPVIMVTSKAQETDRVWGLRQGAVDYLVKPVAAEQLVAQGAGGARDLTRACKRANGLPFAARTAVRTAARARPPRPRGSRRASRESVAPVREWVGVAFRLGGEAFLLAREETREVLGLSGRRDARAGRRAWIRGLANVRGQLLPVVDLRAVPRRRRHAASRATPACWSRTTARSRPASWSTRCWASAASTRASLRPTLPPTLLRCERYLAGAFKRGAEVWPVFSVRTLLESPQFMQAAAS